ncbi:MAG: hypothetical protein ABSG97_01480 [Sedimentisphaerales bacterium]|jgi:hypothetical protein
MKIRAAFLICVICAAVTAGNAKETALPKTAGLVGTDTVLLVDIGDFNQFRAKFEKTGIYKLYNDPSMSAFAKNFTAKVREKIEGDKDSFVKSILDANVMPEGRLAFVMTAGQQETSPMVISQWGRNIAKIKDVMEKMALKSVEKGAHRAIESYRDVNIVTLTTEKAPTRPAVKDDDDNTKIKVVTSEKDVYCFVDDCLIIASDTEVVKFVVSQIKGTGASSLAGDADYIATMGAVGPYHDVDIYVNFRRMIKQMTDDDTTGESQKGIANLGLDGTGGLGFSAGIAPDAESMVRGKIFLRTTGMRKGILKMLEMRSEPVRVPRFVPASACSVSFLNLDIKRAYDELCSIIYGFEPAAAMMLQQPIPGTGSENDPGISIRPDIIEYLGTEIVIAQSVNKPFSKDKEPTEICIAVGVNNRAALEKSLSLIHKRLMVPNNPEPTRELLGYTIYLVGPAGVPVLGGSVPMVETAPPRKTPKGERLAFTITDTHLIFGPESAVELAIRTLGGAENAPVNSAKWFNIAKSAVPSVVGSAAFEDNSASGELLWWMLKDNAKSRRASMGMGPAAAVLAGPDAWDFADFSLLPEFGAVKKYFGLSAGYGISRPDGFFFEFKYLNPQSKD